MGMAPTAIMSTNKHSWVWHHEHSKGIATILLIVYEGSWVHDSAHVCSWALLSSQKCSWVILRVQVFDSVITKICLLLTWLPCHIFPLSWSRFEEIQKLRVLKSTLTGILKNVQYIIYRPLGSWEIQKAKVETFLVDTLYDMRASQI